MILPLVLWANMAQQQTTTYIPPVSDKFVLVRKPGQTPARLKQALQADQKLRIADLFPRQDYDFVPLEGTKVTVVIEKSAVPFGALNDSLRLITTLSKSPDLTAVGQEIPDSIAEMIFALSFADFSKATPEVRNRLVVGASLQYKVELISSKRKFSFGHLPDRPKTIQDRVLKMTWPSLPQSVLKGEEPSDQELPPRPKALAKDVTIEYSFAGRPADAELVRLANGAIERHAQAIEKQIREKISDLEARLIALDNGFEMLKSGGTRSELPSKVLEKARGYASMPVLGKPADENAMDELFATFERFSSTRRAMFLVPIRSFPGNASTLYEMDLLP